MAADSYVGEPVTAQCPECSRFAEIPDPDAFGVDGYCSECKGTVTWEPWDGPVSPR